MALIVALIALAGVLVSAAVQLMIGLRTSRASKESAAAATTAAQHAGRSSAATAQAAQAATTAAQASTQAVEVSHRAAQTLDLWRQREETFRIVRWASDHAVDVRQLAPCLAGLGALDAIVRYPIILIPEGLDRHGLLRLDLQFIEAARQSARQAVKHTLLSVVETAKRAPAGGNGNAAIAAERSLEILEQFPDLEVHELELVNEMRERYSMSAQEPGRGEPEVGRGGDSSVLELGLER